MVEQQIQTFLQQGIAAARAGQKNQAYETLLQVVELDENNVQAWLWLSTVIDDPADKLVCLENVLELDPSNRHAQAGLAKLARQKDALPVEAALVPPEESTSESETSPPQSPDPSPPKPVQEKESHSGRYRRLPPQQTAKPQHLQGHASLAGALLKDSFAVPAPADRDSVEDVFADKYLCPRCAAKTHPDDKKCGHCGYKLWVRKRLQEKPSVLYRLMFWGQLGGNVIYLLGMIYAIGEVLSHSGTSVIGFLIFLGIGAVNIGYYLFWLVALIKRWKFVYILTLIGAVFFLGAMATLTTLIAMNSTIFGTLICGGPFVVMGVGYFFMTLSMGADFAFNEYRVVLTVDTDVKTGATLMERGRRYAEQGLWAKAAVHFRRAAYQMSENVDTHLSLAVAYINLNMYDMALEPLQKAKQLDQLNPKIDELSALLHKKRDDL